MKKSLFVILALSSIFILVSCFPEKPLENITININLSGEAENLMKSFENEIYWDTFDLEVQNTSGTPVETYSFDKGSPLNFSSSTLQPGDYILHIEAIDKSKSPPKYIFSGSSTKTYLDRGNNEISIDTYFEKGNLQIQTINSTTNSTIVELTVTATNDVSDQGTFYLNTTTFENGEYDNSFEVYPGIYQMDIKSEYSDPDTTGNIILEDTKSYTILPSATTTVQIEIVEGDEYPFLDVKIHYLDYNNFIELPYIKGVRDLNANYDNNKITLNWVYPYENTTFKIYKKINDQDSYKYIGSTTSTNFVDNNLDETYVLEYAVNAIKDNKQSGLVNLKINSFFSGGTGTVEDPYLIEHPYQLYNIKNYLDKNFKQISDIDLSLTSSWDPLGYSYPYFTGTYDGNNKKISNLTINSPTTSYIGLFSQLGSSASITNLTIENADITGNQNIGILTGKTMGYIDNVSVTGKISGSSSIGGISGYTYNSNISNVNSEVTINNSSSRSGGISGNVYQSTITNATSNSTITGTNDCGGIVGYLTSSPITNSTAYSTITGADQCGGIAGYSYKSSIENTNSYTKINGNNKIGGIVGYFDGYNPYSNIYIKNSFSNVEIIGNQNVGGITGYINYPDVDQTYSKGYVEGTSYVGGLAGETIGGTVTNSYSTASIKGTDYTAGLIGDEGYTYVENTYAAGLVNNGSTNGGLIYWSNLSTPPVYNSYFDMETTEKTTSKGGTGKLTEDMTKQITYNNWDFTNIWVIDETNSYPYFQWQTDTSHNYTW